MIDEIGYRNLWATALFAAAMALLAAIYAIVINMSYMMELDARLSALETPLPTSTDVMP